MRLRLGECLQSHERATLVRKYSFLTLSTFIIVLSLTWEVNCSSAFSLDYPCTDDTKRFDTIGLECRSCPSTKIVSASGDECICPQNTVLFSLTDNNFRTTETCVSCNSTLSLTPANDALHCIFCGLSFPHGGYINPNMNGDICACASGYAISEIQTVDTASNTTIEAKMCHLCPTGSWVDPLSPDTCSKCEYPKERINDECRCPNPIPTVVSHTV